MIHAMTTDEQREQPLGSSSNEHGLPAGYPFNPEWEVSPRELYRTLSSSSGHEDDGDQRTPWLFLLDCRTPEERTVAKIEPSGFVPMQEIPGRLAELQTHGSDREIIVYCHHGQRSLQVAMFLRQNGLANVKSMAGGIDAWSQFIDPDVPRY